MKLSDIFSSFSRRNLKSGEIEPKIEQTLRNKILLLCRDTFSGNRGYYRNGDYFRTFLEEIHNLLQYRHGKINLVENSQNLIIEDRVLNFLISCIDKEFLDFVEDIFKVECFYKIGTPSNTLVSEINEILLSENSIYELTEQTEEEFDDFFHGKKVKAQRVVSYPQIIKKINQVTHVLAVEPALKLISDISFKSANKEYLEALEDYKNLDYGDCLTKCCSALESVMKIICNKKGWIYKQTDTAKTLVTIIFDKAGIEPFFEPSIMIVATLRNKLSKSHGAGTTSKQPSQNVARFMLNSTASAIVFLIEETK